MSLLFIKFVATEVKQKLLRKFKEFYLFHPLNRRDKIHHAAYYYILECLESYLTFVILGVAFP